MHLSISILFVRRHLFLAEPASHRNGRPTRRRYLLNRIGGFLAGYRECVFLLLKGAHAVIFPHGTLQRRRYAGAVCHGPNDRLAIAALIS